MYNDNGLQNEALQLLILDYNNKPNVNNRPNCVINTTQCGAQCNKANDTI